jgi:hypothetical protein
MPFKIVSLIVFCLLAATDAFSQRTKSELLARKWTLVDMVVDGNSLAEEAKSSTATVEQVAKAQAVLANSYLDFMTNAAFEMVFSTPEGAERVTGTWSLTNDGNGLSLLNVEDPEPANFLINELTDQFLVLEVVGEDVHATLKLKAAM